MQCRRNELLSWRARLAEAGDAWGLVWCMYVLHINLHVKRFWVWAVVVVGIHSYFVSGAWCRDVDGFFIFNPNGPV